MTGRDSRDDATVPAFSSPSRRADGAQPGGRHAAPPPPDPNAKTFGPDGRYQVVTQIGRGGFGTVYRAFDHRLAKYVAIKAVNVSDIPANELQTYIRLFDTEAKIAAQLDHAGIVTVLDYDPYSSDPFIVMPLVEGGTLHDWGLEHPRMPWPEVVDLGVQVAEALHYAHMHGVQAHRDVKPGNIFCSAGKYKVGDFGIARRVAVGSGVTRSTFFSAGTPRYMAPEQILTPRSVDARTDLFSLAAVLYEVVTGRSAFRGVTLDFDPEDDPTSAKRIVEATFRAPTPIRKIVPEVPPPVAKAIERGLHLDPSSRFRDCAAFAKALQHGDGERKKLAPRPDRLRARNRRATVVLVALLACAGYMYWPQIESSFPMVRSLVRGGNDVELAREAAKKALGPSFAAATWNEAEARLRQAEETNSSVYREDAVRLYWLTAVRALIELIKDTEVLADRSLAREYATEFFQRAETTWQKERVGAFWVERALVEGVRSAVDEASEVVPTLTTILTDYQQAAVGGSRRARAALKSKLADAEARLNDIRRSATTADVELVGVLVDDAREAIAVGDLPTAQTKVRNASRSVESLATESLEIARARAEKARWEAAALRIERRALPPELAVDWKRAEEKYEEGKSRLEAARKGNDIGEAETAAELFEETKEMLATLNKAARAAAR